MRLLWAECAWAGENAPPAADALVVDSFLASEAWVLDLDVHERRFAEGCAAMGLVVEVPRLDAFLVAARRALPAQGRWFPRLEAHAGVRVNLVCWLRPAPAPSTEIRLRVEPEPDPRRHPKVKGPDLAALAALRERAREHGADDMVLLAEDGSVVETAHSALLWWRGDTLCHPDPALPWLTSVTARRVLARASRDGVAVEAQRCPPVGLRDAEVWALNALHGIRPVVGWQAPGLPERAEPPDPDRLAHYRA